MIHNIKLIITWETNYRNPCHYTKKKALSKYFQFNVTNIKNQCKFYFLSLRAKKK